MVGYPVIKLGCKSGITPIIYVIGKHWGVIFTTSIFILKVEGTVSFKQIIEVEEAKSLGET